MWLNVNAIAKLFKIDRTVGNEGKQTYKTKYYNLDMIISIGFRVNSKTAIKFRAWANKLIKEYIVKGFNLNDGRNINE